LLVKRALPCFVAADASARNMLPRIRVCAPRYEPPADEFCAVVRASHCVADRALNSLRVMVTAVVLKARSNALFDIRN